MDMTRRTFLQRVGQAGGSTAVYQAMGALGLTATGAERAAFALSGDGRGKRVLILGAGLAGLCAAYELGKLGYDCRILEARKRVGGRCHTIRGGTTEVETDGQKQTCTFDEGHYFNPGPARIPQQHITLDYCRELGVAVEPFGNLNDAAYFYNENVGTLSGKRVRAREAKADVYGYTCELLAKALNQNELDKRVTPEDKDRLVAFLTHEGSLSPDLFYHGGSRRGFTTPPGGGMQPGKLSDPFDLHSIVQSGFGEYFQFTYEFEQQLTMMQVVGGTDQIAKGFERKLKDKITYEAPVEELRQTPNGVRVVYKEQGKKQEATADYCVCAIPLSLLRDIPADFSPEMSRAVRAIEYGTASKVALQFKRRFWEEDDRIFSGITWTNMPLTQIFYPSYGFLGKKGVLVGSYNYGPDAMVTGALSPKARIEWALREGAKIHPQYPKEFETGFSVAWHKTPYNLGAWSSYNGNDRTTHYPVLNRPDGRIYMAGEHISYLTGWMAGALESARLACTAIHERAMHETSGKDTQKGKKNA